VEHVPSGQRLYFSTLEQLNHFIAGYTGWQSTAEANDGARPAVFRLPRETVRLVQESMRIATLHANQLSAAFYMRLLSQAPELRPMFPDSLEDQARKFITMLTVIVEGLDHHEQIVPILQHLGYRHVGYGVAAAHYVVVGDVLIDTLAEQLGDEFTPEMRTAWHTAYATLANTMLAVAPDRTAGQPLQKRG
jgi:nitric oxide dioxygenase